MNQREVNKDIAKLAEALYRQRLIDDFTAFVLKEGWLGGTARAYMEYMLSVSECGKFADFLSGPFVRAELDGIDADAAQYTLSLWQEMECDSPEDWVEGQHEALMSGSGLWAAVEGVCKFLKIRPASGEEPGYKQFGRLLTAKRHGFMAHHFAGVIVFVHEWMGDEQLAEMLSIWEEKWLDTAKEWFSVVYRMHQEMHAVLLEQQELLER